MMTEMVKYQPQSVVRTMDEAERAAGAMAASGFFSDTKQAAQALVKILAGQEMGFGPFAAMTGVHVIQGKPSIGANLMAAAVKRSGRYDYRVTRLDDTGCEVVFFDGGREVGRSAFTAEDAGKAQVGGKDNWKKFPRNMYFARAMSNGVRWYCPDVFGGTTAYTPDELGAIEDVDGHIVEVPAKPQPTHQDAPETTAPPEPEAEQEPQQQPAPDDLDGLGLPELQAAWRELWNRSIDAKVKIEPVYGVKDADAYRAAIRAGLATLRAADGEQEPPL